MRDILVDPGEQWYGRERVGRVEGECGEGAPEANVSLSVRWRRFPSGFGL